MSSISKVDKNFSVETNFAINDAEFYDVKQNEWCLFGLMFDTMFKRMPSEVAEKVNEGVYSLYTNTSGGRLRFVTDSPYVAIFAKMPDQVVFPHMPQTGISGFDMYDGKKYVKSYIPAVEFNGELKGIHRFAEAKEREIMIHFPLYNNVTDLHVAIKAGCSFKPMAPYKRPQKIVFYGSSITQGGCVSRPDIAYPAQVSNALDCDFINLGFSGSARGEFVMADYIASLNPDVLVLDYDHNAPNLEFLERTHEPFFKAFRELKPTTPIILMSAPNILMVSKVWFKRREVIKRTYQNAVDSGDRNVYFIDGETLWGDEDFEMCTVDCTHPNDLGHYRMAKKVIHVLKEVLDKL